MGELPEVTTIDFLFTCRIWFDAIWLHHINV